jgi:tetratricopeptide (TPR) repeat protein
VRITAQLINTEDGYHIWSENFDRNLEDIFVIQDEISSKIVSELSQKIICSKLSKPALAKPTSNIEAYNLYLKGLFYWNKWSADYAKKALEYYRRAIDLEPQFALAYSAISACYVFLAAIGYISSKSAYTLAKEYATKSLELDSQLSESHLSLAMVKFFLDWDWIEAEKYFNKSIELNPGSAVAYHNYSLFLSAMGRFSENIEVAEKACQLDPLSLVNNNGLGNAYFYAGRFDEAIQQLDRTLELDPNFVIAINSLGWIYLKKGNIQKAIQLFKKAQKQTGLGIKKITPLAYAYAKTGKIEESKRLLAKMVQKRRKEKEVELNLDLALIYLGLEDYNQVFYHLEEAFEHHYGELVFLRLPQWKELTSDARYDDLIHRIGL